MSLKNKIQQVIAKRNKKKKMAALKRNASRNSSNSNQNASGAKATLNAFWSERIALFASLFFFAFGMGLISDGKKIYQHQLKLSQRVDYKATLNPN